MVLVIMPVFILVRNYINTHGLKQKAVALKSKIPYSTFNAMMNGKRRIYADELEAICKSLNVSPEAFILWKD